MSVIYFAWIDPEETTHLPAHERHDERGVSLRIEGAEDRFPTCAVEIKNPRVGLLGPGRKRWAAIAVDLGDGNGAQRVFMGRLVGIPEQVTDERVRLHFDARPLDYYAQKRALAETLKVTPYYDPLWLSEEERDDPNAIIKARPVRYHVDRVSLDVTTSDIASGEDGTLVIGLADHRQDTVGFRPGDVPGRRCEVDATVSWTQEAAGTVDISQLIKDAFPNKSVTSYTGHSFLKHWPDSGTRVGAGWTVADAELPRSGGVSGGHNIIAGDAVVIFERTKFRPHLVMGYEAKRTFVETARFSIVSNVQDVYALGTEPEDEDPITITLRSRDADEPIDGEPDTDNPEGLTPIRDKRRRQYFTTDRGKQSLEYLIALARVALIQRARAVEVSCDIPLALGIDISCRKNAQIIDPRLPGGEATGKIVGYVLWVDGDSRTEGCGITIGCMVGEGGSVSGQAGTPSYVELGVLEDGIQVMTGAVHVPITGEVTYDDFGHVTPNDDGVDFFDMKPEQVVLEIALERNSNEQENVLSAEFASPQEAFRALNNAWTELCITFLPLTGGPFETVYDIAVSDLQIDKQIDLSAGSTA